MNPEFQHNYVHTIESIFILGLLIISMITFIFYKNKNERLLGILPLLALLAHQVEEYVLSSLILGDFYHFLNWAYRIGMDISPLEVITINAPGWIIVGSLILFKNQSALFTKLFLLINSILLANASFHLGVATSLGEYSPGMITSLFMYLPLYIYSILLSSRNQLHFRTILLLSVLGFVIHFIMLMRITVF